MIERPYDGCGKCPLGVRRLSTASAATSWIASRLQDEGRGKADRSRSSDSRDHRTDLTRRRRALLYVHLRSQDEEDVWTLARSWRG